MNSGSAHDEPEEYDLYVHSKRPQWGLSILAWEQGDKRGYQFEDGQMRVFKHGFYHNFVTAEKPEGAYELIESLKKSASIHLQEEENANSKSKKNSKSKVSVPYPFKDQLRIFLSQFPEGFEDPAWLKDKRGLEAKSRLKRHRQAAIDAAQEAFAPELLQAKLDAGEVDEVVEAMVKHLKKVDLVQSAKIDALLQLDSTARHNFIKALLGVLNNTNDSLTHFKRYRDVLRGSGWHLVTAIPALIMPKIHVCIRPNVFRIQAASLTPGTQISPKPTPQSYRDAQHLAETVTAKLIDEGHTPRDMFDVYDFIWNTLRPSAAKHLPG